jgi:hypothetical protein
MGRKSIRGIIFDHRKSPRNGRFISNKEINGLSTVTERQIDCIDWLVDKHGGDAIKWTKEKGFGFVEDEYGEIRKVELHWYQEPSVGKVEMKMKERNGEIYIDD